jgi:hypothetical protein
MYSFVAGRHGELSLEGQMGRCVKETGSGRREEWRKRKLEDNTLSLEGRPLFIPKGLPTLGPRAVPSVIDPGLLAANW